LVSVPVYYYAAQRNIVILAAVHVVLAFLFGPINMFLCMRILQVRLWELVNYMRSGFIVGLIFIAIGMFHHLYPLRLPVPLNSFVLIGGFGLAGAMALWFLERTVFRQLLTFIKVWEHTGKEYLT